MRFAIPLASLRFVLILFSILLAGPAARAAGPGTLRRVCWSSNWTYGSAPGPYGTMYWDYTPSQLSDCNGRLVFWGFSGNAFGLWTSGGTSPDTFEITHFNTLTPGSDVGPTGSSNGLYYFSLYNEIWRSDGTAAGLIKLSTSVPRDNDRPRWFIPFKGLTYFMVNATELWRTDGFASGTEKITTLSNPNWEQILERHGEPVISNDFFYFSEGKMRSDGTTNGTIQLRSFPIRSLSDVNGTLYGFINADAAGIYDFCRVDGNSSGVTHIKDDLNGYPSRLYQLRPGDHTFLFLTGDAGSTVSLWRSDGTSQGTVLVREFAQTPDNFECLVVNGVFYFTVRDGQARSLWKSDGTTSGTLLVRASIHPWSLVNANGTLYFVGTSDRVRLWVSDGTMAGTVPVPCPDPAPLAGIDPDYLTVSNGRIFLRAKYLENSRAIWTVDPLSRVNRWADYP